jgi:hypothetical protein
VWCLSRRFAASLAAFASLLLLAGCGSATDAVPIAQESTAQALRARLETAGLDVTRLPAAKSDFFHSGVRRVTLSIGGPQGSLVNLYRFRDAGQAADAAAGVSHDGMQVPTGDGVASVEWVGPPHFFRQGRLIALFCEGDGTQPDASRDRAILTALQSVMGRQFAGSRMGSQL